jgi:carbon monoxide dehydrogenase subunit G
VGLEEAWTFLVDPVNLTEWWPRVVRVEYLEGEPGTPGLQWTAVVEADSRRRLRLDYELVVAERPDRILWEHRLEGTVFGTHLARQATEVELVPGERGTKIRVTLTGELRGAAKLAGPSLKSDQKKLLETALESLGESLERTG